MSKKDFKNKYPLHVQDMCSIFQVKRLITGVERFDFYVRRVDRELSSLLHATSLLQQENPVSLAKYLGVSVRTAQRYNSSISLPINFLKYLYFLQTDESTLSNSQA